LFLLITRSFRNISHLGKIIDQGLQLWYITALARATVFAAKDYFIAASFYAKVILIIILVSCGNVYTYYAAPTSTAVHPCLLCLRRPPRPPPSPPNPASSLAPASSGRGLSLSDGGPRPHDARPEEEGQEAARAASTLDGTALEWWQGEEWQSDADAQVFLPPRCLGDALKTEIVRAYNQYKEQIIFHMQIILCK